MSFIPFVFLFLTLINPSKAERGSKDLVQNVPGLSFEPNYQTFSGYLYANNEKTWKMHYM
jgi:hypothetical protein